MGILSSHVGVYDSIVTGDCPATALGPTSVWCCIPAQPTCGPCLTELNLNGQTTNDLSDGPIISIEVRFLMWQELGTVTLGQKASGHRPAESNFNQLKLVTTRSLLQPQLKGFSGLLSVPESSSDLATKIAHHGLMSQKLAGDSYDWFTRGYFITPSKTKQDATSHTFVILLRRTWSIFKAFIYLLN